MADDYYDGSDIDVGEEEMDLQDAIDLGAVDMQDVMRGDFIRTFFLNDNEDNQEPFEGFEPEWKTDNFNDREPSPYTLTPGPKEQHPPNSSALYYFQQLWGDDMCKRLVDETNRIPNVTVSAGEKGETELEISDDPYDCKRLDVSQVPCLITLSKIGRYHVVDASMQEEACTLARVVMGVTESGNVTAVRKGGSGSLDPDSISDMMESGKRVGKSLGEMLMKKLTEEEGLGKSREKKGFLR